MQVAYEPAFVVLTANDAFLGGDHTRSQHTPTRSCVLRRTGLLWDHGHHTHRLRASSIRIQRLVLVILGMEQHGFKAERLTFEATILDVVV